MSDSPDQPIHDRLSSLTPEQRALFEMLRKKKAAPKVDLKPPPVHRRAPAEHWPLSFDQERLWFLYAMDPQDTAYNIDTVTRLAGRLDVGALRHAYLEIARRHEIWRTRFPTVEGWPVQVVHEEVELELGFVDLLGLPEESRLSEAHRVVVEHARHPFVLEEGNLVRASMVRLAEEEHYFVLTVHHIVTDWVTFQIFWGELITLYEAFSAGRPSPLPELPVQYADFSVWQREWMQGDVLETYRRYWTGKLEGAPLALDLPTDRPRPTVQSRTGDRARIFFDAAKANGLKALARREGVTLFMTMLAIYQAVLSRHSGQDIVLVGTANANRNRPEIEPLLGFFLTQLVFCTDLGGDPTLRELLQRVREVALGAYKHQELPFSKLVEALQPERDLSRHPIVQVILLVLDGHFGKFHSPGLDISAVDVHDETARYEQMIGVWDAPDSIYGWWEFQDVLFDPSTIARQLDSFHLLADALLENPDRRLSEVPVMTPEARYQALVAWNAAGAIPVARGTLHGLVAARAAEAPGEIALVHRGAAMTRADLAARSAGIARALRAAGVGPEARVAVCLPRTPDLVAAVLGALEAGGAYVPLDPAHPRERLEYLLADSGAAVLLTAAGILDGLAPEGGVRLEIESLPAGGPEMGPEAGPGNLAYLIYTSGSTGRPKAVAIEHRSAVALLGWARDTFGADERAGVLASTSLGFDLSVFELFVPLAWGGVAVLVDNALELLHGPGLGLPAGVALTLINTVPSVAAELARGGAIPASVRTMNLAGEPLRRALVDPIHAGSRVERVYNLYGPSEATTYSTFALVPRGVAAEPTIGGPVAGTRVYVLNRTGNLVPAGSLGELCLGGAGLARGYLGRPGLTAERFVPDPFGDEPGGRLYRTGDRVRFLASGDQTGELEFLGRLDHQVKVRGFRVEPGEIEALLLAHPAVREAAVLAREDRPGDRRLVAYVVAAGLEGEPGAAALRDHLRGRLPEPLLPSAVVFLETLPLTPNGKVDRQALARLGAPEAPRGETAAPRTPDEEVLAGIWSELLGVEQIGIRDDFFALGGHSLLANRLLTRLRDAFGVDLPIRAVFQASTVEAQARKIEAARQGSGTGEGAVVRPPIEPLPRRLREAGVPLSFAQERLWFLDRLMPGSPAYNLPLALEIVGDLPTPALAQAAFGAIVERHEALRTVFVDEGGRPSQRVLPAPAPWPLPLIDLSALPEEARQPEAVRLAAAEAVTPFDLAHGPLLRTVLLRLESRRHALLLTIHHIVSDAWSMGVLVGELTALLGGAGAGAGSPVRLPALPVQYPDYAVWQRGWLTGDELARQAAFWRDRLAGAPTALDLPTDRPRPPVQSFRGGLATIEVPADLTRAALDLARHEGATLFMVLLAAWGTLLARLSGQRDLLLGTAIANRDRAELERLIGFFVNTLVLRVSLHPDAGPTPSFAELLEEVRRTALDAYAHRDLPFEKLVEELQPRRDRSRTPLFQAMLVLHNAPVQAADLTGLRIAPLPVAGQTAKFDLTATFAEEGGRLVGQVEYAADLFDAATVERWNGAFLRLLAAAVENSARPVSELPLLSEEERRQLLAWNPGPSGTPAGATLPGLFAAQAARAPEAVALVTREVSLPYRELAERVSRLAGFLRRLGVGPEVRAGVCLPRTADLPVALLAVLEAGGAYVPLDPAYPRERLEFMLEDSGAAVLLTATGTAPGLAPPGGRRIDLDAAEIGAGIPGPAAGPDNLAYVIYTSGSTGRPKGVAIEHRSAAALIHWAGEVFTPEELNGLLASTSVSFDLSVFELFVPLCSGGRAVLAGNALDLIGGGLEGAGVTLVNGPPSVIAELARTGGLPATVRTVNLAGEALPRTLADRLYALPQIERVYNLYGPSEDTTYSTFALVERRGTGAPPIGSPVTGTWAYVLDADGGLVPTGVSGELFLGGEGLARGYLGRPNLTAERFVPDPFAADPGERLYRTGDLVRRRGADGALDFLGRIDHQVKIRGFRIELGEIEAALGRHPGVRNAAVLARQDGERGPRLVAYVALRSRPEADAEGSGSHDPPAELRRWLARSLPEHMLPSSWVWLDDLPLSPNGKVDRLALRRIDPAPAAAGADHLAPRTPLEERLVQACSEVLGIERVGMRDSFFDLGGHSLLATQLLALLQERWGIEVTLQDIFDSADLADLGARITERELRGVDADTLEELMADFDGLSLEELRELLDAERGGERG